jgi:hypothetical protein
MNVQQVQDEVLAWLQVMVVGEGLCPFAARPLRDGLVRISVCEAGDADAIYRHVLGEMQRLLETPADEIETTVVAVPAGLAAFDDYLDMLAALEDALAELNLEGVLQIASFHPDYVFAETGEDEVSNFTNRSPYPLFHLLREEALSQALENYPDAHKIPERNQARMRELGRAGIERLLRRVRQSAD